MYRVSRKYTVGTIEIYKTYPLVALSQACVLEIMFIYF